MAEGEYREESLNVPLLNPWNWHCFASSLESNSLSLSKAISCQLLAFPPSQQGHYKPFLCWSTGLLLAPPSHVYCHPETAVFVMTYLCFRTIDSYSPTWVCSPKIRLPDHKGFQIVSYSFSPSLSSDIVIISQANLFGSVNRYINPLSYI